jgi:hypothetical protein
MINEILPEITQLVVWFNLQEANIAKHYASMAKYIPIGALETYCIEIKPWTKWLENKNVLIIHPFKKSIEYQYARKHKIWSSGDILPDFNLKVIAPPQSPALIKPVHNSWFESLEDLKEKMNNTDFDVALIGAGAYSLPLAVHAKKLGKHGIHVSMDEDGKNFQK